MLTLNDGRNELWQWDTGRNLTVDADCSQVHFSNKVFGRSIDVDVVDGVADIPDILLQTDRDLIAWAFVGTAENGYTKISKVFKVNKRNKPADYVFTPPEQTTLEEIKEKIEYLESIQDPDAIKNAVEDYLEQNPVEAPVQSVNGKTGKVKLTSEDLGAISQDDLQKATNKALAQAKESGEFDGTPGADGEDGGYYTPVVTQPDEDTIQFDFTPSKADMPAVDPFTVELPVGQGPGGNAEKVDFVVQDTAPEDTSVLWVDPTDNSDDGFQEAVNTTLAQAKASGEFDGPAGQPGKDGVVAVTGATVGQTVKISAVDENGVPTAWEPTDFPSAGGTEVKEWEEFLRFTVDNEETTVFDFSSNGTETLESKRVKEFYIWSPNTNTSGAAETTASVLINNKFNITGLQNFNRSNGGYLKLGVYALPSTLSFSYFGRDSENSFGSNYPTTTTTLVENNGIFVGSFGSKSGTRNFTIEKDGIPLPFLRVDYIKTITVSLSAPCKSGIEFIVFVR